MFRFISTVLFIALFAIDISAQQSKKQLEAIKIVTAPVIDGILDDKCWSIAKTGTDFVECEPNPGTNPVFPTELKIVYDNKAIYFGAYMYDSSPDSILREVGPRDSEDKNADYFAVCISPFNDGLNELAFKVSAAGIQIDKKNEGTLQDISWDAVWASAVRITDKGWNAEIKIPWSALRFPKSDGRIWGINCWRNNRRYQEVSTWNFVDINNQEWISQSGELSGISDINPPLRLSFTPYISGYWENYPYNIDGMKNTTTLLNGGMDVKYGINESFTLDMTLIPDFGQVQSDNRILNLTPFETKYDEKRPFFMEGTELFSTADLFYSRRIGGMPNGYYNVYSEVSPGEKILKNPTETKMINAVKFTGRTNKGLGIGIFNAVTRNTYARLEDELGTVRNVLTQPWTNYSILVASLPFRKTSYFSLVNTNVYYGKGGNLANVSGFDFKLADKKNIWSVTSTGTISQKFDTLNRNPVYGSSLKTYFGKVSGKFQFGVFNYLMTDKYNPNDLGYIINNNYIETGVRVNYNIFKPFWKFNNIQNRLRIIYNWLYEHSQYTGYSIDGYSYLTFTNSSSLGVQFFGYPSGTRDYFEPRAPGRYYSRPAFGYIEVPFSSDPRKSLTINAYGGYGRYGKTDNKSAQSYWGGITAGYRLNNKFSVSYGIRYYYAFNNIGYAKTDSLIRFGQRDNMFLENSFKSTYFFSNKLFFSARVRHYWSTVEYRKFYTLNQKGNLESSTYYGNHDISFNAFNVDMGITWRFAPGSELNLVWKNSILDQDTEIPSGFLKDCKYMFRQSQMNSISFKAIYYLDYQYLKKR